MRKHTIDIIIFIFTMKYLWYKSNQKYTVDWAKQNGYTNEIYKVIKLQIKQTSLWWEELTFYHVKAVLFHNT